VYQHTDPTRVTSAIQEAESAAVLRKDPQPRQHPVHILHLQGQATVPEAPHRAAATPEAEAAVHHPIREEVHRLTQAAAAVQADHPADHQEDQGPAAVAAGDK
jgi:hypothetical protein